MLPERWRAHYIPVSPSVCSPGGYGTEVNETLIGIFFKAHKTVNWGVAEEMSHYHVVQAFSLKALPYTTVVAM